MKNKADKKLLRKLGLFYGIIIAFINYLGYLFASSSNMPVIGDNDFKIWLNYIEQYPGVVGILSSMAFIIPSAICIIYSATASKEKIIRRIINIPVVYALFGSIGWFVSFVLEAIVLLYLHFDGVINAKRIITSSFLNIFEACIFISTFGFLVLDIIHRKIVLPKYFPEGELSKYPGVIRLSTGVLFTIFYFSVGIFPVGFLLATIYGISYDVEIGKGIIVTIVLIILFGMAMTWFISDHFSSPLKKLRVATKEMTNSNYDVRVDVVSSDDYGDLADNYNDMALSLSEKTRKILAIQDSIIRGMAVMVEQRDNSTGGHINRTSDCVRVFMNHIKDNKRYDFSPSFCAAVIKAAPMHDLGKIAVDDAVLRKPGRFTDEEYQIMKGHAAAGQTIVDSVLCEVDDQEFKDVARHVAHYHHEKWNGTGYPEGLSGQDIPIEARIMALADVFDALVSKRCYKDSMSYDKAFQIIKEDLGSHFDPELGALFLECRSELIELYESYDN